MLKKIMATVTMCITMMGMSSMTATAAKEKVKVKTFKKEDIVICNDGTCYVTTNEVRTPKRMVHNTGNGRYSKFEYDATYVMYIFNEDCTAYYQIVTYRDLSAPYGHQYMRCDWTGNNWYPCIIEE